MIKQLIDQPTMQGSSVKKLRQLFNNADEVHRGIEALGGAAKNRDPWLIYLMLHKTDSETQQAWAHKTVNKEFPSFEEFLSFVSERCDALESCESIKPITTRSQTSKTHQLMVPVSEECVSCKADHKLHECSKFKSLDVIERKEQAATLHVCFNCLGSRHRAQECLSRRRCSKCGRKHHTLLHTDKVTNQSHITRDTSESSSKMTTIPLDKNQATTSSSHAKLLNACHLGGTILPTAVVKTQDRFGQFKLYSALLDSGSQITFVSKRLVTQLGIHCKPGRLRVEGIATSRVTTLGSVYLTIHSQFDESCCIKIKAFVLPKITTLAASSEILCDQIEQYSDLQLADPAFYQQKEIDILIGADYFFHILREKQIEFTSNMIARDTIFGYIIAGLSNKNNAPEDVLHHKALHVNIVDEQSLDVIIRQFWEQEEISETNKWSSEEEKCEEHFKSTFRRNQEGRYIVQLPLREDTLPLGHSYNASLRRLLSMERKFTRNPEFKDLYDIFMDEYISLDHMRAVPVNRLNIADCDINFLPHHGIIRDGKSTTKLRVVFDGSAATSTGVSINDKLMVGPTIQDTLWTILVRFRSYKIAITADIEKMYRQILIDPSQTSLQRILWRRLPTDAVQQYELQTVTYGTSAAPFLATRVLRQLAEDCKPTHPQISVVIKRDFYVDDLLTGADSEGQAIKLKREISHVLAGARFPLRKWRSNYEQLKESTENDLSQITDDGRISPILGLYWESEKDEFLFKLITSPCDVVTKRNVLSISGRIFDPLGWLAPFTIKVKLFMQQLWIRKLSWDEKLPLDLEECWQKMHGQFEQLNSVTIQRYTGSLTDDVQLHGFSDASESAYAATIYARVKIGDRFVVTLITAKSKVAPINQISLPRLELCGAHLLTKLTQRVLNAYQLKDTPIWLWSDSTIVLAWLSNHPRHWKTYVANRVSAMHTALPHGIWRHVRSKENPSDLATRGIPAKDLINNKLWFRGPEWLSLNEEAWPSRPNTIQTLEETRIRELNVLHVLVENNKAHPIEQMLIRSSNWT